MAGSCKSNAEQMRSNSKEYLLCDYQVQRQVKLSILLEVKRVVTLGVGVQGASGILVFLSFLDLGACYRSVFT